MRKVLLVVYLVVLIIHANAQAQNMIVSRTIRFPFDSSVKIQLINSLNSFLLEPRNAADQHAFIRRGALLETMALLDEIKNIEIKLLTGE